MAEVDNKPKLADEVAEIFTLKTLHERVWRLESENKELKVNNSILQTQYTSQCETQSDILRTLHANLDENYSKIEELENKILRLEQQLEDQKQDAKDELDTQTKVWESRVFELQQKNEHLEGELKMVNNFRLNKADMEADIQRLRQQLQQQEEDHKRDISAFDRKKAIEIDNLKKDMQKSIKETRDMLNKRTKDQLDNTTKRTIMENEQMATELHFQSKETNREIQRNQALQDENAQLKRHLLIHKDLENELAKRTNFYQKIIKRMQSRERSESVNAERSIESLEKVTCEEKRSGNSLMEASTEHGCSVQTEDGEALRRQLDGVKTTLQTVRSEFAHYRRDHATLTQLQDQSTRLIIATLYELKNQRECDPFPPASYDEHATWQFTNMTSRQKEYFFRVLLEKLNSSMCGSCFPTGPQPQPSVSTGSLPPLVKDGSQVHTHGHSTAHFSQFLWSVATHGAQPPAGGARKELMSKSCQTETVPSDPCFKEGLWSPESRMKQSSSPVTPAMVAGNVRTWGSRLPGGPSKFPGRNAGRAV